MFIIVVVIVYYFVNSRPESGNFGGFEILDPRKDEDVVALYDIPAEEKDLVLQDNGIVLLRHLFLNFNSTEP